MNRFPRQQLPPLRDCTGCGRRMRSFNRECSGCRTAGAENSYGIAAMAREARLARMAARGGVSEPGPAQDSLEAVAPSIAIPGSLTPYRSENSYGIAGLGREARLKMMAGRSSVAPAPEMGGGSDQGTQPMRKDTINEQGHGEYGY